MTSSENDYGGSRPYDNGATGSIQGVSLEVDVEEAIAARRRFWFDEGRFRPANDLTNHEPGPTIRDTAPGDEPISVALRAPRNRHYVFYREDAAELRMDLRGMERPQPVGAGARSRVRSRRRDDECTPDRCRTRPRTEGTGLAARISPSSRTTRASPPSRPAGKPPAVFSPARPGKRGGRD